jgi:hypothetical protein
MLEQLIQKYQKAYRRSEAMRGRIERRLENAKQRADKLVQESQRSLEKAKQAVQKSYRNFPSWIDVIIDPIAEALCDDLCQRTGQQWSWEVLGPFGICAEVSIHFSRKTKRQVKNRFNRRNLRSITFIPLDLNGEEAIAVRDRSKSTGRYKENTLGDVNGMNHPTVHIPTFAGIEWFRTFVR